MKIDGYTPRAEFVCPFCGGQASVGFMGNDPTATHTFPYCRKFESLSVDEYWHVCAVELRKTNIN